MLDSGVLDQDELIERNSKFEAKDRSEEFGFACNGEGEIVRSVRRDHHNFPLDDGEDLQVIPEEHAPFRGAHPSIWKCLR